MGRVFPTLTVRLMRIIKLVQNPLPRRVGNQVWQMAVRAGRSLVVVLRTSGRNMTCEACQICFRVWQIPIGHFRPCNAHRPIARRIEFIRCIRCCGEGGRSAWVLFRTFESHSHAHSDKLPGRSVHLVKDHSQTAHFGCRYRSRVASNVSSSHHLTTRPRECTTPNVPRYTAKPIRGNAKRKREIQKQS